MAELIEDITVTALAASGTTTVSHSIGLTPDEIIPDRASPIRVTAQDATSVSFENTDTASSRTARFRLKRYHSIDRGTVQAQTPLVWGGTSDVQCALAIGDAVANADIRAVMYIDGSGALATSADDGIIGATGVRLGYLLYAEHAADHVHMGHLDKNTSATTYQLRFDPDGDVNLKAPGASVTLSLIAGDSGTSALFIFTNNTSRWNFNSNGHFLASTDNSFDIGANGATRPRNVYVAGIVAAGNGAVGAPSLTFDSQETTGFYKPADGQIGFSIAGTQEMQLNATNLDLLGVTLKWAAANEQTTVGAAGGASALPATPTKFLKITDSAGTTLVVPAYAAA